LLIDISFAVKAEDADLLAIMNHLEVENSNIEDDSLLGALTQSIKTPVVVDDVDAETACKIVLQNVSGCSDDEDDSINFTLPLQEFVNFDKSDTDVDTTDYLDRTKVQEFTVTGKKVYINYKKHFK
jgi:hypothetical protein